MDIVEPYARIMDPMTRDDGVKMLRRIEAIARVSHASEDRQTEESWERFITSVVLQKGDWSVTQHAFITVEAVVDRGVTHEWVRHRIGAYTQASTRFIDGAKNGLRFIAPQGIRTGEDNLWQYAVTVAENAYHDMRLFNYSPQIARSVLPNALASKLIVTYSLSIWRYFFLMRTTKEAHPAMRQVTIPLLKEFQEKVPLLFQDIEPMARQIDNLQKAR